LPQEEKKATKQAVEEDDDKETRIAKATGTVARRHSPKVTISEDRSHHVKTIGRRMTQDTSSVDDPDLLPREERIARAIEKANAAFRSKR
jgi:hypothetical protein